MSGQKFTCDDRCCEIPREITASAIACKTFPVAKRGPKDHEGPNRIVCGIPPFRRRRECCTGRSLCIGRSLCMLGPRRVPVGTPAIHTNGARADAYAQVGGLWITSGNHKKSADKSADTLERSYARDRSGYKPLDLCLNSCLTRNGIF